MKFSISKFGPEDTALQNLKKKPRGILKSVPSQCKFRQNQTS